MLLWRLALVCSSAARRPQIVTIAPACAKDNAIAAPIPVPPPVTSACFSSSVSALAISDRAISDRAILDGTWRRLAAASETVKLIASGVIGRRPGFAAIAEFRRRMQRPVRIGEMRSRQADEIGAPSHQDRVDVIGLVNVADRHRGHAGLIA